MHSRSSRTLPPDPRHAQLELARTKGSGGSAAGTTTARGVGANGGVAPPRATLSQSVSQPATAGASDRAAGAPPTAAGAGPDSQASSPERRSSGASSPKRWRPSLSRSLRSFRASFRRPSGGSGSAQGASTSTGGASGADDSHAAATTDDSDGATGSAGRQGSSGGGASVRKKPRPSAAASLLSRLRAQAQAVGAERRAAAEEAKVKANRAEITAGDSFEHVTNAVIRSLAPSGDARDGKGSARYAYSFQHEQVAYCVLRTARTRHATPAVIAPRTRACCVPPIV